MPSPQLTLTYIDHNAIRITQFWWRLYQTTSGSRDPDSACYCVEHLCWSWKDGDIHSYGAPHFYTLTNITVQLVIAHAEHLTNGQRLQIMEAGGSSAECISKRHEWIGIKPGTGLRFSGTSEGWNNTDSDIHTEGTNRVCSLCQKELCTKRTKPPKQSKMQPPTQPDPTLPHYCTRCKCFNVL